MKRHLPSVTLVVQAPVESPNLGAKVVNKACEGLIFASVRLVTTAAPTIPFPGELIIVPDMPWDEWQKIQAYGLHQYFDTEHALCCECDGFPINPHLWDDSWLSYDYIGAPWRPQNSPNGKRIGNGGFSLQSKRFRELLESRKGFYKQGKPSDVWMCTAMGNVNTFLNKGMRIADVDTAIKFSYEEPIPEYLNWTLDKSFGFHGRNVHPQACNLH